jgi:hypothetical protein
VELDSTTPRNALEEGTTRAAALRRVVIALDRQIQAEMRSFAADQARQAVAVEEAGAAADEAAAQLEAARRQSDDLAKLRAAGIAAAAAAQEAKASLARVTTLHPYYSSIDPNLHTYALVKLTDDTVTDVEKIRRHPGGRRIQTVEVYSRGHI